MATTRHGTGTDVERALREFGTHRDLPANRHSALQAIRRHAEHRRTQVTEVYWEEYDDDRIRPVIVRFEDGTAAKVSWGWVSHFKTEVLGAESGDDGSWTTWLPENRRQNPRETDLPVRVAQCACAPGLEQPVGSECLYCGDVIAA